MKIFIFRMGGETRTCLLLQGKEPVRETGAERLEILEREGNEWSEAPGEAGWDGIQSMSGNDNLRQTEGHPLPPLG